MSYEAGRRRHVAEVLNVVRLWGQGKEWKVFGFLCARRLPRDSLQLQLQAEEKWKEKRKHETWEEGAIVLRRRVTAEEEEGGVPVLEAATLLVPDNKISLQAFLFVTFAMIAGASLSLCFLCLPSFFLSNFRPNLCSNLCSNQPTIDFQARGSSQTFWSIWSSQGHLPA